jgi:hypothetical protein
MVGLSVMYLGGQGVAKDRREAFVWLNLAAQYMNDKAALDKVKKVRDDIGRGLTKDDIAYAKAESLLLQPESSSVQPNEAESIDHLPDAMPAEPASTVTSDPLQNVPPDTGPVTTLPATSMPATTMPMTTAPQPTAPTGSAPSLPQMELQPSLPAAPRPAPLPASTVPASTTPAVPKLPSTTLPATTPAQPLPPPPGTSEAAPADPVDPVPSF